MPGKLPNFRVRVVAAVEFRAVAVRAERLPPVLRKVEGRVITSLTLLCSVGMTFIGAQFRDAVAMR